MNNDHRLLGTDLDKTAGAARPRVMKSPYEGPTRRKAGGPPPSPVAQTAAIRIYPCGEPACRAFVKLDAGEPLPAGWASTPQMDYRCPLHAQPIPFDDAPRPDTGAATDNDYRAAARAACESSDAITGARTEVPLYADIELDHGGAWVECRIFITDAQAQGEN